MLNKQLRGIVRNISVVAARRGWERILRSHPLMRAPIWVYQAGAVLGSRLLMIQHIGRKSGAPRYVVVDVVDHPARNTYVITSAFGAKAQWFRNIQANPRVRVYTGSRAPAPATARILTRPEADRALDSHIKRRPRAWERFKPVLEKTLGSPITENDTPLPIVELRLG